MTFLSTSVILRITEVERKAVDFSFYYIKKQLTISRQAECLACIQEQGAERMYLSPTYKKTGKTLFDIPDDTEVKVEIYSGIRGMLTVEEKETTAGELKKEILESFAVVSDGITDRYAIRPRFDV